MNCWASQISECRGGQTAEHYFTKSIGDLRQCYISGLSFAPDGKHVGRDSLKSYILCQRHNNALSDVDQVASGLADVLVKLPDQSQLLADQAFYKGASLLSVDGDRFARWLAKTYCNLMTLEALHVDSDYVRFAFGLPTTSTIHVYFVDREHLEHPWETTTDIASTYFCCEDGKTGLCTSFFDFTWILTNFDCKDRARLGRSETGFSIPTTALMHKPEEVTIRLPISDSPPVPYLRLRLRWNDT